MTGELEADRLQTVEPFETIENPSMGQRYRLLERGKDSAGEYLRFEARYRPDARQFPEHVHPHQSETVRVLAGEMVLTIDGSERVLGPDDQLTLPAGAPHVHRTATGTGTRALVEVRPPLAWVGYIRMLSGFAPILVPEDGGAPNPLAFAVLLDTYPDIAYSPDIPIGIQKGFAKLVSPIGRLRGYGADTPPAADAESERATTE